MIKLLTSIPIAILFSTAVNAFEIPSSTKSKSCNSLFSDSADSIALNKVNTLSQRSPDKKVYPIRTNLKPESHIMFGFESEFTMSQSEVLLQIYHPRSEFGVSRESWSSMSFAQRKNWVTSRAASLPSGDKDIGLIIDRTAKVDGVVVPTYLPEKLILDETGNLEIILDPVDTFDRFVSESNWINEKIGAGSMQGTVSSTKDSFLAEDLMGLTGLFSFVGVLDPLQKLDLGADRYIQDQSKETVKAFKHPFLGPLTRLKQAFLNQYLRFNKQGEFFDSERKSFIAGRDDSFKYSGMLSYRPDIGGSKRVATEVRDAHNDIKLLQEKVARATLIHRSGLSEFVRFGEVISFDTRHTYSTLPSEIQVMLQNIYPASFKPGLVYLRSEVLAREVFRNFAFPVQDWKPWLKAMNALNKEQKVKSAQSLYVFRLRQIAADLASSKITREEAQKLTQGAIALFPRESGLLNVFEKYLATYINNAK